VRATQLAVSFDCRLLWRRNSGWHLKIAAPRRWPWWPWRGHTHHVQIFLDNSDSPRGVVRFDGEIWRHFGPDDSAGAASS
jgi:hypothetical protein